MAAAAKNRGFRFSLANSQRKSLSNALTPCNLFEVIFQSVLIEMSVGHRQPCVYKQPDCRAGVQTKVADRQLIGTVYFDILNAKFALKQVSSQCSIGHRTPGISPPR